MATPRRLSAHFVEAEFRDRRTGEVRVEARLVYCLEQLRKIVGRPLRIVSGYRSPSTNRAVGGATRSQHLYGAAADIPRGYCTLEQAKRAGFTGVGTSGKWVTHVDVRPGSFTTWRY